MLEYHFWANFRKWVPHKNVDEVYDIEKIGFEGEEGFVILLRLDHFGRMKQKEMQQTKSALDLIAKPVHHHLHVRQNDSENGCDPL